jgi:hypothetical protein
MVSKNTNVFIVEENRTLAAWWSNLASSVSTANKSGFIAFVVNATLRIAAGLAKPR